MSIKDRLNEIIDHQGKTLKEMSTQLDISYRTLQNYLLGERTNISIESLKSFHNCLNVNINWLLTGKGEMYLNKQEQQEEFNVENILQHLTSQQKQELLNRSQEMRLINTLKVHMENVEAELFSNKK